MTSDYEELLHLLAWPPLIMGMQILQRWPAVSNYFENSIRTHMKFIWDHWQCHVHNMIEFIWYHVYWAILCNQAGASLKTRLVCDWFLSCSISLHAICDTFSFLFLVFCFLRSTEIGVDLDDALRSVLRLSWSISIACDLDSHSRACELKCFELTEGHVTLWLKRLAQDFNMSSL